MAESPRHANAHDPAPDAAVGSEDADPSGVVHVVDDDADLAESLRYFLAAHWIKAVTYPSAEAFLSVPEPEPGCLVLDLRMPGIGGLELLERLAADHALPPTVVLTAHGDVGSAVKSMKLGAIDFLSKPHDSRQLLAVLKRALARGVEASATARERRRLLGAVDQLTPREQEVFKGVVAGRSSRDIAETLGLQPKSVEIYRGRVLSKLGYSTSLELMAGVLRSCPEMARDPLGPGTPA